MEIYQKQELLMDIHVLLLHTSTILFQADCRTTESVSY
jgi:hypothetical protein